MRFVTFEHPVSAGGTAPRSWGVVLAEGVIDLGAVGNEAGISPWPHSLLGLIRGGQGQLDRVPNLVEQARRAGQVQPLDSLRLLAPIPRPPRNVFALGLNYAAHAAEGGAPVPDRPIVFTKATTSVIGPDAGIVADERVTTKLDWEVELGVVIGRGGRWISATDALDHVFGYTIINDVSARDIQGSRGNQFFLGKSLDTACPMGPWIVSADDIPDPQNLELSLCVNGAEKQHSNTKDMIFTVAQTIEDLSSILTLEPGDIISTGTPSGIGGARTPPEFLTPGDVVELTIEQIGTLSNPVVAPTT